MTINEFFNYTELTPSFEEFNQIHEEYINSGLDKQTFCELYLQNQIKANKKAKRQLMKDIKARLNDYMRWEREALENNQKSTLAEEIFFMMDENGNHFSICEGCTLEELKAIKISKLVYIVESNDCEIRDTEIGDIYAFYNNHYPEFNPTEKSYQYMDRTMEEIKANLIK